MPWDEYQVEHTWKEGKKTGDRIQHVGEEEIPRDPREKVTNRAKPPAEGVKTN